MPQTTAKPPRARYRRRPWTVGESEILARDYATLGGPAVARALRRSLSSVYGQVEALGLKHRHKTETRDGSFRDRLRALHSEGLTDPEIAGLLGCERHTASNHRRALGLPSNRSHARYRSRVAAKTREQCVRAGVGSLGAVRALAFVRFAVASGWPADLRPREVNILESLIERGPMTRPEIAEALGMPWLGSRKSLKSNDPGGSYLATLIRRGLVVNLGRIVRQAGSGKSLHLYSLSSGALKEA